MMWLRGWVSLLFFPVCYFGGSSSSQANTTTKYDTTDSRIAAGDGTTVNRVSDGLMAGGAAIYGSGNTVTTADPGIVAEAFRYASNRDALAGQTLDSVISATRSLIGTSAAAIDGARSSASGQISERVLLIGGGLTAAALAVAMVMRRGKA